jgi:tripartite-type tricarboxylate transporter receptor subunit TctC
MKDFTYISRIATGTNVLLVHPSVPVKSVAELVALARSRPQAIRYASSGVGSAIHLTTELLQRRTGMELVHVPYAGPQSVIAVASGEVEIGFAAIAPAMPMIQAKRLNALAVASIKRIAVLAEVPTIAESGYPGFDVTNTYGILAPARTPPAVVEVLNAELRNIVQMEDVRAKFAAQGLEAVGSTPAEYRAVMEAEKAQWTRVINEAHITAN